MPDTATFDDFSDWIGMHLDKAKVASGEALGSVKAKAAAAGAYRSSRTILMLLSTAHDQLDIAIDTALGELKRAERITDLDHTELRQITEDRLRSFSGELVALVGPESLRGMGAGMEDTIDNRLAEFDKKIGFALRQFDVGFLDPLEPEIPLSMTNSINIGTMAGGAVQQGSPHATQNVSIELNIEAARTALTEFETAITAEPAAGDQLAEITADIDTIKAQLTKPSPSRVIIGEAGKTLRSIIEGIAAGALSPHLGATAAALWRALCLS